MILRDRKLNLRFLATLVALVQLLGPPAAALADAQLEAASNRPNAASHVESHGRPECARVHSDDCALCQYLATASPRPPARSAPSAVSTAGRPIVPEHVAPAPSALDALPLTRAPPSILA